MPRGKHSVAYLDIETNYVGQFKPTEDRFFRDFGNHQITVLGIRLLSTEADVFTQLVGKDITRENVLSLFQGAKRIVTYNGRSIPDALKGRVGFDLPVIAAQIGITLDKEFEHTDLVPECWKRNLYGGQKKVEEALGLKRKLPSKDGAWAMATWREFKATGNTNYLADLLLYNKEDVFMLREIENKLAELLPNQK